VRARLGRLPAPPKIRGQGRKEDAVEPVPRARARALARALQPFLLRTPGTMSTGVGKGVRRTRMYPLPQVSRRAILHRSPYVTCPPLLLPPFPFFFSPLSPLPPPAPFPRSRLKVQVRARAGAAECHPYGKVYANHCDLRRPFSPEELQRRAGKQGGGREEG